MKRLAWLLLTAVLLTVPVRAQTVLPDFGAGELTEALTEEQLERMGGADPLNSPNLFESVMNLLSQAVRDAGGYVKSALSRSAMLLSVCLLCALCGMADTGPVKAAVMAGVLALAALCTDAMGGMIRLGTDTVQELSAFSQLLMPVLAAASAASGAVASAPALYGVTVLMTDVLLSLITGLLIPGVYVYFAMAAADCALGNSALRRICSLISWAIKSALKVILYGFTAFLTLTQVISGTADAMTTKAAKLTLSGMVPVVGSIISDASETLLVSASMIRNSIGVFGMLAVLSVCIMPFLKIGIQYLALKITAAAAGVVAQEPLVRMVDAVTEVMGMLLAMTGTAVLLTIISVVCTLKVTAG